MAPRPYVIPACDLAKDPLLRELSCQYIQSPERTVTKPNAIA